MEGSKRFNAIGLDSFNAFFQRFGATRTGSGRAAGGGVYHDTPGAGCLGRELSKQRHAHGADAACGGASAGVPVAPLPYGKMTSIPFIPSKA